jgi:methylenetetrahydrofolate dehydrogenase (NAD+)
MFFCLNMHLNVADRSEVVGRPLAALLANDGARVLSVDIDSTQVRIILLIIRC